MPESELPEEVQHLIQACIPTVDALEILLCLVRRAPDGLSTDMIVGAIHPSVLRVDAITEYLKRFRSQGLIAEETAGVFAYQAKMPAIEVAVRGLLLAYDTQPVTLIRTVYALADQKQIQAFSDAFRLKKDQ